MQQEAAGQRDQNVTDGGDRQNVAEVRPTQQDHVGEKPQDEERDAQRDPGVGESEDEIEWRTAHQAPDLAQAVAEKVVSRDLSQDHDKREDARLQQERRRRLNIRNPRVNNRRASHRHWR